MYKARAAPVDKPFDDGPSRLAATLLRVLPPLSVLVLAIYIGFIPAHARTPFQTREVLRRAPRAPGARSRQ